MADWSDLDPSVSDALELLEQAVLDLRGAADDRLSCSQTGQPDSEEAELTLLRDALERLCILAGGSDG